jgi:outer membrane protein OmpA-like peptidoglycan-associated protein
MKAFVTDISLGAALLLFGFALAPAAQAQATCAEAAAAISAAPAGADVAALNALFDRTSICPPEERDRLGRRIAARLYDEAVRTSGAPDEKRLLASLAFGRTWQTLATLGDLAFQAKAYALAAQRYQDALSEINDAVRTPKPPQADVILQLRKRAEEAGLLADSYVATPRGRGGENEGLAANRLRGITIKAVALPVEFAPNSAVFTPKGREAAEDMASILVNEKPVAITLVGHTDPRGSPDANVLLSKRRAQALAAYLSRRKIAAQITVEGRGSAEPYVPDDPSAYTREQIYQLDRRVELVRGAP